MTMYKDITAIVVDTENYNLTKFALETTLNALPIQEVISFSDQNFYKNSIWVSTNKINSIYDYSEIILKHLWLHVKTEFVLILHWDGMGVQTQNWTDDFLKYDYIGAPWIGHPTNLDVGNGGFSLRSKRLIDACRDINIQLGGAANDAEDVAICSEYREFLTKNYNIKYAPTEVASKFSVEHGNNRNSFGFHGIWNIPYFFEKSKVQFFIENLDNYVLNQHSKLTHLYQSLTEVGYSDLCELLLHRYNNRTTG